MVSPDCAVLHLDDNISLSAQCLVLRRKSYSRALIRVTLSP
jgi:hypothetical protein